MVEEIAVENGRISNFEGLVTLILTLDRVKLHTIMHHSSTSTYMLYFTETEESFCAQTDVLTDVRMYVWMDGQTLLGGLCRRVDLTRKQAQQKAI